ncbi:MAG TPA: class I SAM-dependent methyltransferase [Kofleriaceae bacterium]|nr:class I SAM-dependent methyltransferase [Kofleriaceae bacterium]
MSGRAAPDPKAVREGYEVAAAGYDDRRQDRRHRARWARIDRPQLAIARGAERVLEIGCGTGRLLAQTRARYRVGIDLSTAMLRSANESIARVAADAHALPFADATFDAVLAGNAVFRYLDYPRAFAECARVLTGGGRLAVHQYAARTWRTFGRPRASTGDRLHLRHPDELCVPAAAAGLATESVILLRAFRLWPYVLPVPAWAAGAPLWSYATVIFRKRR